MERAGSERLACLSKPARVTSRGWELFPREARETVSLSTEQKNLWKLTSVVAQRIYVRPEGKVTEHVTLSGAGGSHCSAPASGGVDTRGRPRGEPQPTSEQWGLSRPLALPSSGLPSLEGRRNSPHPEALTGLLGTSHVGGRQRAAECGCKKKPTAATCNHVAESPAQG